MAATEHKGAYMKRNFLLPKHKRAKLVGFSDASELAYAAVIFLVSEDEQGKRSVNFVTSKSRIAPLTGQTIPRMELLGALILSRLIVKIKMLYKALWRSTRLDVFQTRKLHSGGSKIHRAATNSMCKNA